ncbi:MAG: diguanylate cyclase [Gammaproteobacteria bacterium]|nr:diguanylate cyclase [Gammaproteobacteria bacterium]
MTRDTGWLERASRPLAILLGAFLLSGPAMAAEKPGTGLRFHQYTIENGLNQNSVYAIAQDDKGFLWIGTEDGLHRFDGNEMKLYEAIPGTSGGLTSDYIYDMEASSDHGVWLATYGGGLLRFDTETGDFRAFTHDPENPETLSSDAVLGVTLDPDGSVWALAERALNHLQPDTGKVTRITAGEKGIPETTLVWLRVDASGNAWLATEKGLFWCPDGAEEFRLFEAEGVDPEVFSGWVGSLDLAANGDVMVGMGEKGIYRINRLQQVIRHHSPEDIGVKPVNFWPSNVLSTRAGELWIAVAEQGLFWEDEDTGEFINYRHEPSDPWSLSDDQVMVSYEDRSGILWFGTLSGGINKFNPATRAFRHYRSYPSDPNSLVNRLVWSIIEDRNGDLWVGTETGLSHLDRRDGKYTHYRTDYENRADSLISPYVSTVYEDRSGKIWVGTYYGLSRLDPETGEFRNHVFAEDDVDDWYYANSYMDMAEDSQGRLWLATGEGLVQFAFDMEDYTRLMHDEENPRAASSAPSDYVFIVEPALSARGFWVAGEHGVALFDPETQQFSRHMYRNAELPAFQSINTVHDEEDGTVWIGTDYRLLKVSPEGTVTVIGEADGLPSNNIYEALQDGDGDLWLATNRGLAEYSPTTGDVRAFDVSDGLQSLEFNGNAGFRSRSGEMFFGGINGFNSFYPSRIVKRDVTPNVEVTKFYRFNEEVDLERPIYSMDRLDLSWRDSVIGFEFAVFDFAAPAKSHYRYMLDGFDDQWLEISGRNHVTYTNLDPGSYTLRVRGANSAGNWSEEEARLSVNVAPPPWQTWWAYLLYLLAALSIITLVLRFHFLRVAERHQLENEQQKRQWAETLQQLTHALGSSLDSSEVAEELLESLRSMLAYRKAVLFVEQGVEIHVAGAKGVSSRELDALSMLPTSHSRFFAEIRYGRKPRIFTQKEQRIDALQDGMADNARFLAVPAFSRSDEFALLIIGRDAPPFSEQERDIAQAFLTQSLVALDNARLFAELQNTATTDTLTQVNNRRYFFELAELEFNRSRRYGRDVSIILIDADNFRELNDNYGRDIGDRALKLIASVCRNNVRHFDIIGRYGGEDFIIMLPETPVNVAADVADRLRQAIEAIRIDTHKGELQVTVSVGVAVVSEDIKDLPALINRADTALYEAKRTGRNKVIVAEQ